MLVADRGADAPLASNAVTFADSVGYKSGGCDKTSRRVNNLDDTSLNFDERELNIPAFICRSVYEFLTWCLFSYMMCMIDGNRPWLFYTL